MIDKLQYQNLANFEFLDLLAEYLTELLSDLQLFNI